MGERTIFKCTGDETTLSSHQEGENVSKEGDKNKKRKKK